jgi:hypothetical protein
VDEAGEAVTVGLTDFPMAAHNSNISNTMAVQSIALANFQPVVGTQNLRQVYAQLH